MRTERHLLVHLAGKLSRQVLYQAQPTPVHEVSPDQQIIVIIWEYPSVNNLKFITH